MRIVAGKFRGARIEAPKGLATRPTPDRVRQALFNVLENAVKFSPAGSRIRLKTYASEKNAVIEVQDFGRGIRAEVLPHVFDLFAQGHSTLDRRSGGLGIGLSVCKRLVEMHGGTITAHSEGEGKGANFKITLPLAQTPPVDSAYPAPLPMNDRKRVLIVDDNEDAAESVAMLLEMGGHQTKVAYHGQKAIEVWQSFAPDVALLDIGLPDLSGFEVIARLRADGFRGLAIALSGYGQPEDRKRAMESGFNVHLVKPVEWSALELALTAKT